MAKQVRTTRTVSGAAAVIVQQGRILDYIDGLTQRKETPEEYVRQEIAKSLVREYGFEKNEIAVEFGLRLGSRRPRADLVIFDEDDSPTPRTAHGSSSNVNRRRQRQQPVKTGSGNYTATWQHAQAYFMGCGLTALNASATGVSITME